MYEIMLLIIVILFVKSKNIFVSLVTFLSLMHFVEVNFVHFFFDKKILSTNLNFENIEIITICTFMFCLSIFLLNNDVSVEQSSGKILIFKYKDFPLFLFLMSIFSLLFYQKIIVNDWDFYKIAATKSVLEEYLVPVYVVIILLCKNRFLIILPILMISILYGFTGERLKMLIQLLIIFIVFKDRLNLISFKFLLFLALLLSLGIDSFRSPVNNGPSKSEVRVSHFGELTRSSSMLIDFSKDTNLTDKRNYFFGFLIGNVIPSSILPQGFDIKRDLISAYKIPGGGWFPVWFYFIGGYWMVFGMSISVSVFARHIQRKANSLSANLRGTFNYSFYILFITTSVNWIMYTPYQLLKFPIYSGVIIFIYYVMSYLIKTKQVYKEI